jgi:hypothetical protein
MYRHGWVDSFSAGKTFILHVATYISVCSRKNKATRRWLLVMSGTKSIDRV